MNLIRDIKSELNTLNRSEISINKFNKIMLSIFIILGSSGYVLSRTPVLIVGVTGAILILVSFISKPVSVKLHLLWMTMAFILGWIMSRIILVLVFLLVVSPIGILARLSGKRFLDILFKDNKETYWIKRKNPLVDYKKMS